MTRYAEIHLSLWKQGDDMESAMQEAQEIGGTVADGLFIFNQRLDDVKLHVNLIKAGIEHFSPELQKEVEISGDTHSINISGPDEVIESLLAQGIVDELEDFDEDDDYDDDDLDDDFDGDPFDDDGFDDDDWDERDSLIEDSGVPPWDTDNSPFDK